MGRLPGTLVLATTALLFSSASLRAQPKPVLGWGTPAAGWQWWGPKTVYPGHTAYYSFSAPRYRVPVTCSASGNTCDTSGSGYTPLGTQTNVYVTATTVPTGLETMTEGFYATYDLCNVSGTTFKLCRHGTSTVETFSSTGSGVSILFMPASLANSHSFYVASNTAARMGWPSGTGVTWGVVDGYNGQGFSDGFTSSNGYPYSYQSAYVQALKVDIPTDATPGDYTITITDCDADPVAGACPGGSHSDTLTFTATVTALTYLSDANEPGSFPAITGLSTWVNYMTTGAGSNGGDGAHWCNKTTGATTPADLSTVFSSDNSIFYYDGGLVYWRIARWTGDAGWDKCAQNILQQSGYGNANSVANPGQNYLAENGQAPGYRIFPAGFSVAVSQDPRYIQVVQSLAGINGISNSGDATVGSGCYISDYGIRESAYALITMLRIDGLGLTPQDPAGTNQWRKWKTREQRCADVLIGDLNAHLDGTGRYNFIEYFFEGITADALIKWWQTTKDPRVPMVVKPTLDAYYSNYNTSAHIAMWSPEPNGIHCAATGTWYTGSIDDHCRDNTSANLTVLHNLFSPAFAWYWRISGDDTYRTEGDEVFAHAFDGQDDYSGKTFSQLYRYSFNYVGWRQGWLSPERSIE